MERERKPRKATNPSINVFLFTRKNVSVVSLRRYKMLKLIKDMRANIISFFKGLFRHDG